MSLETGVAIIINALGLVYVCGAALKTFVWWRSLGWALRNGHAYAKAVESAPGMLTRQQRLDLIVAHGGGFRPLGAKSVNLRRTRSALWWRILNFNYVKTPIFILEGSLLSLVACLVQPSLLTKTFAVVLSIWICVYSLMIMVEAIVWYVIANDFALVWGDLKFISGDRGEPVKTLSDFRGLGAVTLTAVLASSLMISVIVQAFEGFHGLAPSPARTLGLPTLISSTYYVLATLTTVGDSSIAPYSTLARAAAGILDLMVLLTISFAISAIAARIQDHF